MKKTIAVIGSGNMGSAIAKICQAEITVCCSWLIKKKNSGKTVSDLVSVARFNPIIAGPLDVSRTLENRWLFWFS